MALLYSFMIFKNKIVSMFILPWPEIIHKILLSLNEYEKKIDVREKYKKKNLILCSEAINQEFFFSSTKYCFT